MKDQKKYGVLISYMNIALNMCINLVLVPILITKLGDTDYGIYKIMQSFAGPLIMFNLGISTVVARSIARFRAIPDGDKREKENTLAIAMMIATAMAALVLLLGLILDRVIPHLYGKTYSPEQLLLARRIFRVFVCVTAVHILSDVYKGCVLGRERFVVLYLSTTVQYVLRFVLILLLLRLGYGAVAVACVELTVNVLVMLAYVLYGFFALRERPRLWHADRAELTAVASFSVAILLQAIINQVNNNMDMVILGAMVDEARIITMYSSALAVFSIYNSLISVFSSVYLPKASQLVARDCSGEELTDFVIRPGRVQAMIALAVIGGFAVVGQDFITLWIGSRYREAYVVALMLMIPVTIPLVQNVCLSILDAKLKRMYRSVVLGVMAGINVTVSVLLVRRIGFYGAAVGTVLSLLIGHGFLMNLYYHRTIGLNVPRMFREIFRGSLPAMVLAVVLCFPTRLLEGNVWLMFLLRGFLFVVLYGALLWLLCLRPEEKAMIRQRLHLK